MTDALLQVSQWQREALRSVTLDCPRCRGDGYENPSVDRNGEYVGPACLACDGAGTYEEELLTLDGDEDDFFGGAE